MVYWTNDNADFPHSHTRTRKSMNGRTAELGDLDKVKRVVKLLGFVNCVDGFTQQPQVVNGASDFLVQVRGVVGWLFQRLLAPSCGPVVAVCV